MDKEKLISVYEKEKASAVMDVREEEKRIAFCRGKIEVLSMIIQNLKETP